MNDLFPGPTTSFKSKLQSAVQRLAESNIFIGTSSWKYEGWSGQIYNEQRYHYRGKFAETRFERDCYNYGHGRTAMPGFGHAVGV